MMRGKQDRAPAIRYRETIVQRLAPMAGMLLAVPLVELVLVLHHDTLHHHEAVQILLSLLAAAAGGLVLGSNDFGVELTPESIKVHNLRRRTIRWDRIQWIRIEKILGAKTIVLYEYDGRRTRLRAPSTGFLNWDRRFEEKLRTIEQFWAQGNAIGSVQDAVPVR